MTRKVIDSEFLEIYNPIKSQDFKEGVYRTNKNLAQQRASKDMSCVIRLFVS